MNCETCQTTLVLLASGKLDRQTADRTRAHLQVCESCRTAFERLEVAAGGGEPEGGREGRRAETEPVLIEAKEAALPAALQAGKRDGGPGAGKSGGGAGGDWRERVGTTGRLLMGRQFAVAIAMLLVAAVGLWYVPRIRENPAVAGTVVDGPHTEDGQESPGALRPAEPLDLTMDQNRRRIRSKQEVAAAAARRRAAALEQTRAEREQRLVDEAVEPGSEPPAAATDRERGAEQDESVGAGAEEGADEETDPEPTDGLFKRAMERLRAGDHEAARTDLARVAGRDDAGEMAAEALLHLGRSYRAEGKCPTALRYYGALLARFPQSARRAEAATEAGECRQPADGPGGPASLQEPGEAEPEASEPGAGAER